MHSRSRPNALCVAALSLLWIGCADGPADLREGLSAAVLLDFRPLFSSQQGRPVSVIDRVELLVSSSAGVTTQQAPIGPADPVVEFDVIVPPGSVNFEARVTSNNGTELYAGSREALINTDGFQVLIDLEARAPVLVVTPDSLPARSLVVDPQPQTFALENRGLGVVEWFVASVTPPLDSCGTYPCLRLEPFSGALAVGQPQTFRVVAVSTPARLYRIGLSTNEGQVELLASADATAPQGVLDAVVSSQFGGPQPGVNVTLLACSAGSVAGSPGTCVPDESIPPQVRSTDSTGVARFAGLPDGFWRLRPDPSGFLSVIPPQTTVLLQPGQSRRVAFTGEIIGQPERSSSPHAGATLPESRAVGAASREAIWHARFSVVPRANGIQLTAPAEPHRAGGRGGGSGRARR